MVVDPHITLLEEAFELFDTQLSRIRVEEESAEDPDVEGIFDRAEYVTGFGFVASQAYIVAVAGQHKLPKADALSLGPRHRCGETIAAIANAAANYWKHHDAWGVAGASPSARTTQVLAALGVEMREYATTNVLFALLDPLPVRFGSVLPFLSQWRDALANAG